MSRGFIKLFYRQDSEKERIEYVDESINQLVRDLWIVIMLIKENMKMKKMQ